MAIGESFAFAASAGVVDSINWRSVKMSFGAPWGGAEGTVTVADFSTGLPDEMNVNTAFEAQDGKFVARHGSSYEALNDFSYTGGMSYHVWMVVDIPMQTYDVWIALDGGDEVAIGKDYAFDGAADTLQCGRSSCPSIRSGAVPKALWR